VQAKTPEGTPGARALAHALQGIAPTGLGRFLPFTPGLRRGYLCRPSGTGFNPTFVDRRVHASGSFMLRGHSRFGEFHRVIWREAVGAGKNPRGDTAMTVLARLRTRCKVSPLRGLVASCRLPRAYARG
jgi:hypothetical protein